MGINVLSRRPGAIIGYRKDGSPIRLLAGGDPTATDPATTDGGAPDPTRLTHKQAINRMKDCRDELERIGGKEHRTAEDDRQFAELVREVDVLNDHVRSLERQASLARVKSIVEDPSLGTVVSGVPQQGGNGNQNLDRSHWNNGFDADPILEPDSVEMRRFRNPWDLSEVRTFDRSKGEVGNELKSRAVSAIERMSGANDKIRAAGTLIIEQWDDEHASIARLCLATSSPEYLRAWSKIARGKGHMVTQDEQRALERAMSLTDSSGGYLVPFQLDPTVIITSAGSLNQIRQVARQVVATGDVWNGVSSGEVSWSWAAEAAESTDDSTTFAQPTVTVHKAHGFVPISIEALADEANVTSEVGRLLAAGKDTLEAKAFITGTGSGQPFGIATAIPTTKKVDAATADALAADDIYAVDDALPARYRGNASWLANRATYNEVRALGSSGGSDMWERIGADRPALLLGRPAFEAEEAAKLDDTVGAGDKVLFYGDFSNYVIADRVGMTVELIPHLVGSNRRPTGQRGWYAYYRVGADSVNDDGFRYLDG